MSSGEAKCRTFAGLRCGGFRGPVVARVYGSSAEACVAMYHTPLQIGIVCLRVSATLSYISVYLWIFFRIL